MDGAPTPLGPIAPRTNKKRELTDKERGEAFHKQSSAVKPTLTEENKLVEHIGPNGLFDDLMDVIRVDEKWFYMTRLRQRYSLRPTPIARCSFCLSHSYRTFHVEFGTKFRAAGGKIFSYYDEHTLNR
jgi:hypothetical protein